jgi:hypothetical protein
MIVKGLTMNMYDLVDQANDLAAKFIRTMEYVPADQLGLDERCGFVLVGEDCVGVNKSGKRSLEYYGGFEYVDKDCVFEIGEFTFYYDVSERVADCLETYKERSLETVE